MSRVKKVLNQVLLIGCGKAKANQPERAADLYTGSLFRKRREYAERSGDPWWILSARYGLADPDEVIAPYDVTLKDLPEVERSAWNLKVVSGLLDHFEDSVELRRVSVEIHVGAEYGDGLVDVLLAAGLNYSWPVRHMGIGDQMAWYKARGES